MTIELARKIEHTLLSAHATYGDIERLCDEAKRYGFAAVCVNSCHVARAKRSLGDTKVRVVATVGFPLGAMVTRAKVLEAQEAVALGADEIDMVMSLGALKSGDLETTLSDVEAVVQAVKAHPVKVILETGALTQEEKVVGAFLAKRAGAAFVKTSTGFGPGKATVKDVMLLRRVVGPGMGIKASGGIHTRLLAEQLLRAGADRIGTSASGAILSQSA